MLHRHRDRHLFPLRSVVRMTSEPTAPIRQPRLMRELQAALERTRRVRPVPRRLTLSNLRPRPRSHPRPHLRLLHCRRERHLRDPPLMSLEPQPHRITRMGFQERRRNPSPIRPRCRPRFTPHHEQQGHSDGNNDFQHRVSCPLWGASPEPGIIHRRRVRETLRDRQSLIHRRQQNPTIRMTIQPARICQRSHTTRRNPQHPSRDTRPHTVRTRPSGTNLRAHSTQRRRPPRIRIGM